ncbi:MAG: hypothetical protein Q8936_19985 [Bacillota bacterium]|nr:hypothetical protein [Bacillota bacterium]
MEDKAKKKFYKKWWFWAIIIVLFIGAAASSGGSKDKSSDTSASKNDSTATSKTDNKELTEKEKADKEAKAKAQAEADKKAKEEAAKKADEEAKAKSEADAKKWQDFAAKNTKQFSAGEYTIGTHLDAGTYDVTFNGSGNFTVKGKDGTLLSNEIGGSEIGVSKYRAVMVDGSKFKAEGMGISVQPVKNTLMPYGNATIYAGYWIVGKDVTKGRYKAAAASGSGNFIILGNDGLPKTNEILGDSGVKEVVIDLSDNDLIQVSSLNQVNLTPTN